MHAVRLHAFGPAENLTYEKTGDPLPGPGQVRSPWPRPHVHLLDTALREGMKGPAPEPPALPTVPGREVVAPSNRSARAPTRPGSASASSATSDSPPEATPSSP